MLSKIVLICIKTFNEMISNFSNILINQEMINDYSAIHMLLLI